jgi:hypothetical protein
MGKLQLARHNLGQVFNLRSGHMHAAHLWCYQLKLPNLKLKTWAKQPIGFPPLDIMLQVLYDLNQIVFTADFVLFCTMPFWLLPKYYILVQYPIYLIT